MLYIDAFNHILPKKYQAVLEQKVPNRDMSSNLSRYAETVPTLLDLDARFRLMDSVEGYMQVLTLAAPTVESVASPEVAVDLCRFANDEMAAAARSLSSRQSPNRRFPGKPSTARTPPPAEFPSADRYVRSGFRSASAHTASRS